MIKEWDGHRFLYEGDEPIIFPDTCVPNYKNAFRSPDMRGAIIEFIQDTPDDNKGDRGIVYFNTSGYWFIISQNRKLSRMDKTQRQRYIKLIGVYPPAQHYEVGTDKVAVDKLFKEFDDGKFKFF